MNSMRRLKLSSFYIPTISTELNIFTFYAENLYSQYILLNNLYSIPRNEKGERLCLNAC
jgi:hypothetical protein